MDDGAVRQERILILAKIGMVAPEGPARSGQLRSETFVPEVVLFINGQHLMGTKKYHEGGIQKQPSRQEALSLEDCAELLRPTHPPWMLDLGTAWASSLPNVLTRSRRQRTLEQGGRRVGQQVWAYAGYDRGQATRRRRSTRLGPEQAA